MKRKRTYSSGKIDQVGLDDLKLSEEKIGQIYPVIKDAKGEIIDGFHRKRVKPRWKDVKLPIKDSLEALKLRVHLNIMRRKVIEDEKHSWIAEARELLKKRGIEKPTHKEIAEALGMKKSWIDKWDPKREAHEKTYGVSFFGYNVWGFRDESWRKLLIPADSNQPWPKGYHGATPAFIIHQLVKMFNPKTVLDSMAGVGTTGYVCKQYGIVCDQFDLYPFPQYGVLQGDAERVNPDKTYDLIFNHIPYLNMVKYGKSPRDLSNMNEERFFDKLGRIFEHNHDLLNPSGIYAVLVGDWRSGGKVVPITAKTALTGVGRGFTLRDESIKLTSEMKSKSLQEYRATKFGYLAQTYDTVLMFKRGG